MRHSSYLGGSGNDLAQHIGAHAPGAAYVAGITLSSDFPVTRGVLQPTFAEGVRDAFVSKITDDAAPPPSMMGRITGGGTVPVGDHFGTFSLSVQRRRPNDGITGNLQYINHATRVGVRAVTFSSLANCRQHRDRRGHLHRARHTVHIRRHRLGSGGAGEEGHVHDCCFISAD